jgi:hypothetical protein
MTAGTAAGAAVGTSAGMTAGTAAGAVALSVPASAAVTASAEALSRNGNAMNFRVLRMLSMECTPVIRDAVKSGIR